jgi:hypothetical protein
MSDAIASFPCIVYKVQTLADNGIRLTLDLPEDSVEAAARLMEARRLNIALRADLVHDTEALINSEQQGQENGEEQRVLSTGRKRKSERAPSTK